MIDDSGTLPMTIAAGGRGRVSTVTQLADIPGEEIWLQTQRTQLRRVVAGLGAGDC